MSGINGIISGQRQDLAARLARPILSGASVLFAAGVALRRAAYANRLLRARSCPIPVIAVGNITAGGTGKTPLVETLVRGLQDRGWRPAVVSRGYGRHAGSTHNDEALILAANIPSVPLVLHKVRYRGVCLAAQQHGANVAVLDDGFQHFACARDLDIVAVDATRPFGYDRYLPRGLLREPPRALRRAGLIVITRADQVQAAELSELSEMRRRLQEIAQPGGIPVLAAAHRPECFVDVRTGETLPVDVLRGRSSVAAFCGIGNPEAFARTLAAAPLGARVAHFQAFPDHHAFTRRDLEDVAAAARRAGCRTVVMTQKDAVKCAPVLLDSEQADSDLAFLSLNVRLAFLEGEAIFWRVVEHALSRAASRLGIKT